MEDRLIAALKRKPGGLKVAAWAKAGKTEVSRVDALLPRIREKVAKENLTIPRPTQADGWLYRIVPADSEEVKDGGSS
jgi:hypothetical protein